MNNFMKIRQTFPLFANFRQITHMLLNFYFVPTKMNNLNQWKILHLLKIHILHGVQLFIEKETEKTMENTYVMTTPQIFRLLLILYVHYNLSLIIIFVLKTCKILV